MSKSFFIRICSIDESGLARSDVHRSHAMVRYLPFCRSIPYFPSYSLATGRYVPLPFTFRKLSEGLASDILFTKRLHAKLFSLGQVIETLRGKGIFQPALDQAVKLVSAGEWVGHVWILEAISAQLESDTYVPGRQSEPTECQSARRSVEVQMGRVSTFQLDYGLS